MKDIPVVNVRNFAIIGHTSSGKTTLTDALLFKLGINDRLGSPADGTSMSDYTEEEKARSITIFAKSFDATYKTAKGKEINMIFSDTPGYMDFFGQVIASARSAESGLVVVDASSGVQVGTHRAWKCCGQHGVSAKGIVITGLDKDNTDYAATLEQIRGAFGAGCVPVVLPLPDGSGVVDVLAGKDVPDAVAAQVEESKMGLMELAAETDDALMEKFFEEGELSPEEVARGLVASVAGGGLVPVFVCMPLKGIGVTELLEGIARLFPSPEDSSVKDSDGNPISVGADKPFVGQVCRTVNDPFVGQLNFVRVIGGTLKGDMEVQNTTKDEKEKVGAILIVNGKKQAPVETAVAGDIVAIPKLKHTSTGDTLCSMGQTTQCEPIHFPSPVTFQAVRAKTQADEDKIRQALSRVCAEDPTLIVERNTETKEIVLQGLGDVHIAVAVELMKSRSNVDVLLSTPKVAYRETVTAMGDGKYKHKKQSGGRGQYGEVHLRVEPLPEGEEEWFVNAIVGGVIPSNFMPAVQKGLVEGQQAGPQAGYPVTGIKVTVHFGSYHDVDSSEVAFKIAASRALREGISKAKPVLLEPIMTVNIYAPASNMGDLNGDLNHKRGRILGMGAEDGLQVITAEVPQAELFHYAAELRSITGGQGTFEMEFSRYDIVPSQVAQKIIAEAEREKEEE